LCLLFTFAQLTFALIKLRICDRFRFQMITNAINEIKPWDLDGTLIDILIGEPFYCSQTLPWQRCVSISILLSCTCFSKILHLLSLYFWYVRTYLAGLLAPNAVISPRCGRLMCALVQFVDYHACFRVVNQVLGGILTLALSPRSPLLTTQVSGFDLSGYERGGVKRVLTTAHAWQYPMTLLSAPTVLATFNFTECVHDVTGTMAVDLTCS
jgi:hypothetical protein